MNLQAFIAQHSDGQKVGDTPENFGECVGLVEVWFDTRMEPHVWGNAKDLYANAPEAYSKGTSWPAPAGAAIVLDGSWGGGAGHTGISLGDGQVFEQNNPIGSAPHVSNYGAQPNGYVGWILPSNYQGDSMLDENHIQALYRAFRGREANASELSTYMNTPYPQLVEALDQGDERNTVAHELEVGKVAVKDAWDQQIYGLEAQLKALQQPTQLSPGVYKV